MSSPSSDPWVLSEGTWKKQSSIQGKNAEKGGQKTVQKVPEQVQLPRADTSPENETPLKKKKKTESLQLSTTTSNSTPETAALTPDPPDKDDFDSYSIPAAHVECIQAAFGVDCDLYRDVLKVGRRANDRQIRIAYFRRGRQVLAQQDQEHSNRTGASIADLSVSAKQRFQAVSMAYEILSYSQWKQDYDRCGWVLKEGTSEHSTTHHPQDDDPEDAQSVTSSGSIPILRRRDANKKGQSSRSVGRAIRWSEEVEELVFKEDPTERNLKTQTLRQAQRDIIESFKQGIEDYNDRVKDETHSNRSSSKRAPKRKVILETKALTQHLESLDQKSLKKNFVSVFLDDLEASLDGLEASIDGLASYTWSKKGEKQKSKSKKGAAAIIHDEEEDDTAEDSTTQEALSDVAQIVAVEDMPANMVSETKNDFDSEEDETARKLFSDLTKPAPSDQTSNNTVEEKSDLDDGDSAQQLFENLTKPAPSDNKTKKQVEVEHDDDSLNQLFADLTKPAPSDATATESTKSSNDRMSPALSSSRSAVSPVLSASSNIMNASAAKEKPSAAPQAKTVMAIKPEKKEFLDDVFGFNPFADESEGGTVEDLSFEAKTIDDLVGGAEPTNMVVETKRRRRRCDGDTMSKNTVLPKDLLEVKHDATGPDLEMYILNTSDDAVVGNAPEQVVHVERPQSSQSGVSSLTGLSATTDNLVGSGPAFWCIAREGEDTTKPIDMLPASAKEGANAPKEEARDPKEEVKDEDDDSTENLLAPENGDQDFITYLMTYLEALAGDLNKFGVQIGDELRKLTCTNRAVLIDSIIVQEDDMQGMLDVLHSELDRSPPDLSTATNDVSSVTKSYTF